MAERIYQNTYPPMDDAAQLEDGAAAITSSGAGSDILDLGGDDFDGVSYWFGTIFIQVSALEFDTGDENYAIRVQLSNSATFASGIVDRCEINLGDALTPEDTDLSSTGIYTLHVDNEINGVRYRYMQLYVTIDGTIVTGITFKAWATKSPRG